MGAVATIRPVRVSLRIFGDDLEPEGVSALLGGRPSHAHQNGEMVDGDDTLKKFEAVETKVADKLMEEIKRRKIPAEQLEMLIRSGRVEKSTPVETVKIEKATLLPLE